MLQGLPHNGYRSWVYLRLHRQVDLPSGITGQSNSRIQASNFGDGWAGHVASLQSGVRHRWWNHWEAKD
jgi:hypothetical protein